MFYDYSEVGPGADFEVGRTFPSERNMRIYLGSYYYRYDQAGDLAGVHTKRGLQDVDAGAGGVV